ncbi:MAG: hypothetical protein J6V15_03870 [Clostridia bacterium]|nr:hypothetical protein [Clostridia bacterium]
MSEKEKIIDFIRITASFIVYSFLQVLIVFAVVAPVGIVWHAVTGSLRFLLLFIGYPLLWLLVYKIIKLLDVI